MNNLEQLRKYISCQCCESNDPVVESIENPGKVVFFKAMRLPRECKCKFCSYDFREYTYDEQNTHVGVKLTYCETLDQGELECFILTYCDVSIFGVQLKNKHHAYYTVPTFYNIYRDDVSLEMVELRIIEQKIFDAILSYLPCINRSFTPVSPQNVDKSGLKRCIKLLEMYKDKMIEVPDGVVE